MANSREILLKLVRMAMGWETDFSIPQDVDWVEVLNLASEQGVEAIALDGFDAYMSRIPQTLSPIKTPEYKKPMLEAIGHLNLTEFTYLNHISALSLLGETLSKDEIPFLVMKGFSCGQYYPIPKHRQCGDIDIYTGNRITESNEALKAAGIDVDSHYYRHSVSEIKGVMIENHRILCDLRGPKKQTKELEAQLESLALSSINNGQEVVVDKVAIQGARYPSADFNALFLPWHVSAHFAFEKVTLRHLLDWALFLSHEGNQINVAMFREAKKKYKYGFSKVADIITNLSLRYLNLPSDGIPQGILDDAMCCGDQLADKVFDYMFVGRPRERDANIWKFRWNNIRRVWAERWKYQEVYGMSVGRFLMYKMIGVIFKVGENEQDTSV